MRCFACISSHSYKDIRGSIFLLDREEETEAQRLSEVPKISNWQIWVQNLSQNDPRSSIQAEIFIHSKKAPDTSLLIHLTSALH